MKKESFNIKVADTFYDFTSAGVCFFTNDKIMLIEKNNGKYEFLGGKVDKKDKNLLDTAIRESFEESNGHVLTSGLDNKIDDLFEYVYANNPGYLYWYPFINNRFALFFIRLHDNMVYDSRVYGKKEYYENIKRTIVWLDIETCRLLDKSKINYADDHKIIYNIDDILFSPEKSDIVLQWKCK